MTKTHYTRRIAIETIEWSKRLNFGICFILNYN